MKYAIGPTEGSLFSAAGALQSMLFLVWGPPSHGPRSRVFARKLGIEQLHFVYSTTRRGLFIAPLKYGYQTVVTLRLLWRLQPRLVFIQSPPSIGVLVVYLYCLLSRSYYIVDAHSDAFTSPFWSRPVWLQRFLARRAVATIVTNEHFQQRIEGWGGHAFILRDIPTSFPENGDFPLEGTFNVVVVNTFADDEPLREVLQAAQSFEFGDPSSDTNPATLHASDAQPSRCIHFYITGKTARAPQYIGERINARGTLPRNVHFTGFLPDEEYYALLNSADAVMCLTTRDHTMQRGACEALSMGKPIITSDWPLLRTYFDQGTVHVDNSVDGIRAGIVEMVTRHDDYKSGIRALQKDQLQEWSDKIASLDTLITQALDNTMKTGRRD